MNSGNGKPVVPIAPMILEEGIVIPEDSGNRAAPILVELIAGVVHPELVEGSGLGGLALRPGGPMSTDTGPLVPGLFSDEFLFKFEVVELVELLFLVSASKYSNLFSASTATGFGTGPAFRMWTFPNVNGCGYPSPLRSSGKFFFAKL